MITLKRQEEFRKVFGVGRWVSKKRMPLKIRYLSTKEFRYALITSRKTGNAVKRNHARRQVREILRDLLKAFEINGHFIFIFSKEFVEMEFHEKKKLLEQNIRRTCRVESN